ncbi:transporter [Asticcacaulis sp. AC466]|uniref:TolC family protein n=1 Tax=Asticcacaulis sp. AC466 TaxID=1282362 RepID=UPI0003C3CBD8|nr:TolC family protein [Asticcacaulis sp. AC466]ESQ83037.1 transporter [Asticcacaulis sp. AC466]
MTFQYGGALTALLLGVGASLPPTLAAADPAPSFQELLRQAPSAPRLQESQATLGQAEGLLRQSRAHLNPNVSVSVENFGGKGPYAGSQGAETTTSVEQTIELGGKRNARIAVGQAGLDAARSRAAQTQANFAFDLAQAYVEAEAAEARLQLAKDALALAIDDARVADALVQSGKEADLRSVQARSAVEAARASVDEAQAGRTGAFAKLTAMVDSPVPFTAISTSLLVHGDMDEPIPSADPLESPGYLVAVAERNEIARRVKVEQTRSSPDVTVSLGYRRLAADDANALVGGVSVPFPIFDRNRGNISAVQSELTAADQRVNIARLDAQADIQSATGRLTAAVTRVKSARDSERTAEEAYRLTRVGYEAGKLPLSEVLNARRTLTDAHNQSLKARQDRLTAEAELARLRGVAPFGEQS